MASLQSMSFLRSQLFTKTRLVLLPARGPYSSLGITNNLCQKKDELLKEDSNTDENSVNTLMIQESKARKGFVGSDSSNFAHPTSQSRRISMWGESLIPWHSFLSMMKTNTKQLRNASQSCDMSKEEKCKPIVCLVDDALKCVKTAKTKPPCEIPTQKRWSGCDKSMCLPCCCPIEKPLRCKLFDITLNTCPRKTYRIASYSECSKRYGRKQYMKECCYAKRVCYARNMADREIKPLLHIKDRQAMALGFQLKV